MRKTVRETLKKSRPKPKTRRPKAEIDAERKQKAVEENSRSLKKAVRKSGKVRKYNYNPASKQAKDEHYWHPTWKYKSQTPKPLSPEAEWLEDKPDEISPIEWLRLMPGYPSRMQREQDRLCSFRSGPLSLFSTAGRMVIAELFYRGPLTLDELGETLGTAPWAVGTILRPLAGIVEEVDGAYSLTERYNSKLEGLI
jgi:hypothetical protein